MVRNSKGQFVKGVSGNPNGRSRERQQAERSYLDTLIGSICLSDWKKVCEKALSQAINGDKSAREWLGSYLQGAPKQTVDMLLEILWDWELPKDANL